MMEEADNLSISPAVSGESKAVISKKKRHLPGMPDPDSEVIVLSPRALLTTNRFICEICNKGFQRDQNLQLHRRGHNLPWKLRQRTNKEVRKRVYVCPEPTCVHHDPARALGDLTGIKKHFSRKHGEKKYRCDRCSKKYAVLSDLKAHVKTCGTREYRCDCGTLFSRRDSFITHRAFCDALAQETARTQPASLAGDLNVQTMGPPAISTASGSSTPPPTPTDVLSPVLSFQSSVAMAASHLPETHTGNSQSPAILIVSPTGAATGSTSNSTTSGGIISDHGGSVPAQPSFASLLCPIVDSPAARPTGDPISLTLSPSLYVSLPSFPSAHQNQHPHYFPSPSSPAVLSATALLQKAEQMGSTSSSSNSSFLHGFRLPHSPISSTSAPPWVTTSNTDNPTLFPASRLNPSMFKQSAIYRDKSDGGGAATHDFLRLGTDGGYLRPIDISGSGFSGMRSGLGGAWDDPSERKPSSL